MLMSRVQTEIASFAVEFCTTIVTAVRAAIQISITVTIDFLLIFVYNEGARVLGLSPFPLGSYFFLVCTVITVVTIANIVVIIVHTEEIHS